MYLLLVSRQSLLGERGRVWAYRTHDFDELCFVKGDRKPAMRRRSRSLAPSHCWVALDEKQKQNATTTTTTTATGGGAQCDHRFSQQTGTKTEIVITTRFDRHRHRLHRSSNEVSSRSGRHSWLNAISPPRRRFLSGCVAREKTRERSASTATGPSA